MPGDPFVIYDGDSVIRLTGTITGGGGSQTVLVASTDISSSELLALYPTPVAITPAPGAGKVVAVVCVVIYYEPGATPYAFSGQLTLEFGYGTDIGGSQGFGGATGEFDNHAAWRDALNGTDEVVLYSYADTAVSITAARADNAPAILGAPTAAKWANGGPIATSHVDSTVTPWTAGEHFDVAQPVSGLAQAAGIVDTVDGGGNILTYHLTAAGNGYLVGSIYEIDGVPSGNVANIAVDTITPNAGDGTMTVKTLYYVVDLT